jgi:hypothetical protein
VYSFGDDDKNTPKKIKYGTEQKEKLVLLLDLDNTLVFSDTDTRIVRHSIYHDFSVGEQKFRMYERPYLQEFLTKLKYYYDVYAFSAGTEEYVESVLNFIDRNNTMKGWFSRKDMGMVDIYGRKGLIHRQNFKPIFDVFADRGITIDPANLIFVDDRDDLIENYEDKSYLYRITPYMGEDNDNELLFLSVVLTKVYKALNDLGARKSVKAYQAMRAVLRLLNKPKPFSTGLRNNFGF